MGRTFEGTSLASGKDEPIQCGQLTLTSLEVLAPIAPLMHLAFTTFQYAGSLTLCLRYDASAISHEHAACLLELVAQRLDSQIPETSQA